MANILIVEDDYDFATLIQAFLVSSGYNITLANTHTRALEALKKDKPNLILMDIMLPGMNGAEIIKLLKKDPLTQDIPVIFITGLLCVKEHTILVDGCHYRAIAKPLEPDDLLGAIKSALKEK